MRIKVLTTNGRPSSSRREALLQALFDAEIRTLRVITTNDQFVIICQDESNAEAVFTPETTTMLKNKGFEPQMPPELKAKLTLVLKQLDRELVKENPEEIKEEIERNLPEAKIGDIFIMKNRYLMKIQFSDHKTAAKVQEEGLYLFNIFISPKQIEPERFTNIVQCMHCYKYGHYKTNCPDKEKRLKLCSECGSNTHNYRDCKSDVKRCLNCGEGHRTLANSCPLRKEAIKKTREEKTKKEEEKKEIPIKRVAEQTAKQTIEATQNAWFKPLMKEIKEDKEKERKEPQVILQLPDDLSVGIMTALIHAHLQNIMEPGLGFRHHAKKVLKKNNLPDLDLGNGDSWGIFKVLPPKTINTTTETTLTQSTISPHPPQPDLGPQDEPETELFTTPQRKPTSTPTPTPAPTPTQSPVRPRTTKTNTPKQSPQQPRPQTTQSVKPKTTHIHRKHTDDLTDSEVDDQSLRHRDGYDLNPKTYGIRLFATEPSRYKHLNRLQLAHEITRGTIKWIYTDNSYQTRIHEQKITQHLHEGNMFIQPNMIEKVKQQNLEHIQNGWYNISK